MDDKKTILLVEDEVIIAMAEKLLLEKKGVCVKHAFNGEEALQLIIENRVCVDLILMDIDLGRGMDGITTTRKILQIIDIPVIFLSSHTESDFVKKIEKVTSYGYVDKNSGFIVLDASIKMAFKLFKLKTDIKKINSTLVDTNRKLNVFLRICQKMTGMFEMAPLMQFIVDGALEATHANSGSVYLINNDKLLLVAANPVIIEDYPQSLKEAALDDHPHIKKAVTSRKHVFMRNSAKTILTHAEKEIIGLRNLVSSLFLPINFENKVIGILILSSTTDTDLFDKEDISLLQGFADQATQVINNIRQFEYLKQHSINTIEQVDDLYSIEEVLRKNEEGHRHQLMNLFDSRYDILTLFDLEGNILLGSSRNAEIYNLEHLIGKNIAEFIHPDDLESVRQVFSGFTNDQFRLDVKYRFLKADGTHIMLHSSGIPLNDARGEPKQILFCTRNISHLKLG
ncbi:MAG: response regulator [Spirochaetes bacterium]|jgi:PAS domain S-box-containing protein|nr:response regulator [Spirochaetota bacterium]